MKVHIVQFYIEQGAEFPFNCAFQRYISREVTSLVAPSERFIEKYGEDFDLIFRISAKHSLDENEIRGPTVFRKDKDIEYSIFVPCRLVFDSADPPQTALKYIFAGVNDVFDRLQIDVTRVRNEQDRIVRHICSDSAMFRVSRNAGTGIGPPVWHAK